MILDETQVRRMVCCLQTIGRSSGQPRELEIWFAARDDRIFLLSGGGDRAHWVRNLQANPTARVRIDRRWHEGRGRIVRSAMDPEDRLARELLAAKYQGWEPGKPLSAWARTALPVVIDLSQ